MHERPDAHRKNLTELERILPGHYKYLVVDPYAVNLIDDPRGGRIGQARLSFYSAFVINAVGELHREGKTGRIVLFSDASFGSKAKSTGELMREALKRQGIPKEQIILFPELNLDNTPAQVKTLARFLQEEGVDPREVAYIGWDYHLPRIQNHLAGYHLSGIQTVSAAGVHKALHEQFDVAKLNAVLPWAGIEGMESLRRTISRFDKTGFIPMRAKKFVGGSHVIDNERINGKLKFVNVSGKKRFEQVMAIKKTHESLTREVQA